MSSNITDSEKDLLKKIAHLAAAKAVNGVYMAQAYSESLGAPVLILVALGEQALAVHQILMSSQVPDDKIILATPGGADFLGGGNGHGRGGH